jgi:hypothetical protein
MPREDFLTKVFSCRCRHVIDNHYAHHIMHVKRVPCEYDQHIH